MRWRAPAARCGLSLTEQTNGGFGGSALPAAHHLTTLHHPTNKGPPPRDPFEFTAHAPKNSKHHNDARNVDRHDYRVEAKGAVSPASRRRACYQARLSHKSVTTAVCCRILQRRCRCQSSADVDSAHRRVARGHVREAR